MVKTSCASAAVSWQAVGVLLGLFLAAGTATLSALPSLFGQCPMVIQYPTGTGAPCG